MGKLIYRIPGLHLLISSLPGMFNRSASLMMSISVLKALHGKLDIKRHSPCILFFFSDDKGYSNYDQAPRLEPVIQNHFSYFSPKNICSD